MSTSPHTPGAQAKLGRSRSPHTPGTQAKLDRSRAARQARARDREVVQKLAAESGIFQGVVFALSRKATSEDGDPAKAAAAAAAGKISTSALLRETIARQGGIVSNTVHKKVGLSQSQSSSSSSSTVGPADEPAPPQVSFLVCSESAMNNSSQRVKKALKLKVPIVSAVD